MTVAARRSVAGYGVAALAVAGAVLMRWLLDPLLAPSLPLVTLFGAVAIVVWYGGFRCALVAAVAGYLACAYLFIAPIGSLGLGRPGNLVGLVAYFVTCAIIIGLGENARAGRHRSRDNAEARSKSDARWRLALDSANLGAWSVEHATGKLTTDDRFNSIFQGSVRELTYEKALAVIHPDDLDRVRAGVEAATRPENPLPYSEEYRVLHPDGTVRWVLAIGRANFDSAAGPRRMVSFDGTLADITARKEVEEQLEEAEKNFLALADTMPQLAWIADAGTDGQVRWFNKTWLDYTGATLEAMQGSGWRTVHHPEHADRVIANFSRHVKEGRDWEDTFPLRGKDGRYRWFLSRMNVIRDASGAVSRIFGTNTDITTQLDMAERLRHQANELADANRRKDEFLATLAHELRNPLAPIRNALQVMKLTREDGVVVEQARAMIERQMNHLVRLVDDLLDASRITSDKLVLHKESVQLDTVLKTAIETSRPLIDANGQLLTVALPAEPVMLEADPIRLAQVFVNLLNNAAKFSPACGHVHLAVERRTVEVRITVTDDGAGIARDELPRIFEMFSQSLAPTDRNHGGLGIGLSLARRLVQMHGGQIDAYSDGPTKGSEFVVRLPLPASQDQGTSQAAPALQTLPNTATRRLRILVADDNVDAATSLALLLDLSGHETHTVHDGLAAFEQAAAVRPDVMLLDIGMPGLDGHAVARRIRAEPWGESIALFALTGWGQDEDRRRSKEAGFDHHLVKPVAATVIGKLLAEVASQ